MEFFIHIFVLVSIYGILALSLNYIAGFTGILSISHATFYGIGAYATAILMKTYEVSFLGALVMAMVITGIVAFIVSFPILKLKNDSLMLVSFGFAIIGYNIMLNWTSLTHGALGIKAIPAPSIFGFEIFNQLRFLGVALTLLFLTFLFFRFIVRSPYGTIIQGVRDNEVVMEHFGHNTKVYKRSVFVLGAMFAAISGALFATYITFIDPKSFQLMVSVNILIIAIFGGLGSLWGSLLGAVILIAVPELLRFIGIPDSVKAETQQILYGFLLVCLMYVRPKGLLGKYKI